MSFVVGVVQEDGAPLSRAYQSRGDQVSAVRNGGEVSRHQGGWAGPRLGRATAGQGHGWQGLQAELQILSSVSCLNNSTVTTT